MNSEPSSSFNGASLEQYEPERRRPGKEGPSALAGIKSIGISSIRDTLSSRRHSKDFAYARGDYLRSRVLVVGVIFAIMTPLWIAIDALVLPEFTLTYTTPGRFFLMTGLIATILLARYGRARVTRVRISAGLLIALPAAFYALVLLTLPPGEAEGLVGYGFIPFLLVTTLSIFPFTLAESALAGACLLGLHVFSQYVTGTWMTPLGWEQIWLLATLLIVALAANYFHLGLLLRLYREATHDSLTGLLNRGALMHSLKQMELGDFEGTRSLLMLDLDNFKKINDSHGHSVGDEVLRRFAAVLRQQVRKVDLAARYGGEEFVAVLMGASQHEAMIVAERIRKQAEESPVRNHDGVEVSFTVSIGVANFSDGQSFDDVLRIADDRLYRAKKQMRNCVVGE